MGTSEIQTRKVQKKNRVAIPPEYLSGIDIDIGDDVIVVACEDKVEIRPASKEQLR